jgi:hypothetical protein
MLTSLIIFLYLAVGCGVCFTLVATGLWKPNKQLENSSPGEVPPPILAVIFWPFAVTFWLMVGLCVLFDMANQRFLSLLDRVER